MGWRRADPEYVSPLQTSTPAPQTVSSARTTAASPTAGSAMGTTTVGTTRMSPTPPAQVRSLPHPQGTEGELALLCRDIAFAVPCTLQGRSQGFGALCLPAAHLAASLAFAACASQEPWGVCSLPFPQRSQEVPATKALSVSP